MIESVKRFYSKSVVNAQRQEAIKLFFGNYKMELGQPTLWQLTMECYLHHIDPSGLPDAFKSLIIHLKLF